MTPRAIRIDGTASRMKSHCQPSSPAPERFNSAPEIGAPTIDENGMASMNTETTRAR
jgi:hypothetical protein